VRGVFDSPRHALDRDCPPLAVVSRAALDPLARRRGISGDFGAERRDMFAPALGRGRGRGRVAWRGVPFEPSLAPPRSTIRPARHRSLGSAILAWGPAPGSRPFAFLPVRRRFDGDDLRRIEIDVRFLGELHAQLVTKHPRAHFHDLALRQVAEFERTERDADQPVDRKTEVLEDLLDLSVFSLSET
jgi:hypothetical protein